MVLRTADDGTASATFVAAEAVPEFQVSRSNYGELAANAGSPDSGVAPAFQAVTITDVPVDITAFQQSWNLFQAANRLPAGAISHGPWLFVMPGTIAQAYPSNSPVQIVTANPGYFVHWDLQPTYHWAHDTNYLWLDATIPAPQATDVQVVPARFYPMFTPIGASRGYYLPPFYPCRFAFLPFGPSPTVTPNQDSCALVHAPVIDDAQRIINGLYSSALVDINRIVVVRPSTLQDSSSMMAQGRAATAGTITITPDSGFLGEDEGLQVLNEISGCLNKVEVFVGDGYDSDFVPWVFGNKPPEGRSFNDLANAISNNSSATDTIFQVLSATHAGRAPIQGYNNGFLVSSADSDHSSPLQGDSDWFIKVFFGALTNNSRQGPAESAALQVVLKVLDLANANPKDVRTTK
jgi:hypothetical protein